ncbi:hypothetical protein K7432_017133 [Basidiobolus ranarum]|uniref:Chitin-binding type-2 domain-containing protein n=1 Tax=Basidiobolus ranarum TaxID=34480 RepID=A0ABR2VKZ7_9FUNG
MEITESHEPTEASKASDTTSSHDIRKPTDKPTETVKYHEASKALTSPNVSATHESLKPTVIHKDTKAFESYTVSETSEATEIRHTPTASVTTKASKESHILETIKSMKPVVSSEITSTTNVHTSDEFKSSSATTRPTTYIAPPSCVPNTNTVTITTTVTVTPVEPIITHSPKPTEATCFNGTYKCADPGYSQLFTVCVNGVQLKNNCAAGTVCKSFAGSIICDWA